MKTRVAVLAAMTAALLVAAPARAHEVLHTIERGRAIAVKAFFADGDPLAYTEYQVFSPVDGKIPHQKGRTDRAGYLAFVPDVPGNWHVRIVDSTGHGLELDVAVDPPVQEPSQKPAAQRTSAGLASWAFALRPILGVAIIATLFAAVFWFYRRKGSPR